MRFQYQTLCLFTVGLTVHAAVAGPANLEAVVSVEDSLVAFANCDYSTARKNLEQIVTQQPKIAPLLWFYIGTCCYREGDRENARMWLRRSAASSFNQSEAYWRLMRMAEEDGNRSSVQEYDIKLKRITNSLEQEFRLVIKLRPGESAVISTDHSPYGSEVAAGNRLKMFGTKGRYGKEKPYGDLQDALICYEYGLNKEVKSGQRFYSPIAAGIYQKLFRTYEELAGELKRCNRPEQEVLQAKIGSQYYRWRFLVVKLRLPQWESLLTSWHGSVLELDKD
jgi:tetratricopeptide (TPR) repeat protein